jgi:hypothetical protein
VDVVGIEASKAELLEIVARIKLHRSFNWSQLALYYISGIHISNIRGAAAY